MSVMSSNTGMCVNEIGTVCVIDVAGGDLIAILYHSFIHSSACCSMHSQSGFGEMTNSLYDYSSAAVSSHAP